MRTKNTMLITHFRRSITNIYLMIFMFWKLQNQSPVFERFKPLANNRKTKITPLITKLLFTKSIHCVFSSTVTNDKLKLLCQNHCWSDTTPFVGLGARRLDKTQRFQHESYFCSSHHNSFIRYRFIQVVSFVFCFTLGVSISTYVVILAVLH
jgi:hypothetical protein